MPYLTSDDKATFKENGYLVKHDTLTEEQLQNALDVIWEHLECDRDDPGTWIDSGPRNPPVGDHPAILATLYESPIFDMAEEIVGKGKLRKDGRPGPHFRFPTGRSDWKPASGGHLDGYYTPTNGVPEGTVDKFSLGTILYLNHVEPRAGGFTLFPGTHRQAAEYFKTHALPSLKGGNANAYDIFDMPEAVEVTGPPGTACFWHGQLVHTGSQNYGKEIRLALIGRLRRIDNDDILFESPDDIWEYYEGIE